MDNEPITDSELRNLRALSTHFYNQDRGKTAFWHMPKLLDEIDNLRGALEGVREWITRLPIPTQGATHRLGLVDDALRRKEKPRLYGSDRDDRT